MLTLPDAGRSARMGCWHRSRSWTAAAPPPLGLHLPEVQCGVPAGRAMGFQPVQPQSESGEKGAVLRACLVWPSVLVRLCATRLAP
jgi:hypothetical protein